MLPICTDSRFECAIGVTGSDDVLFTLGVKIFVSEYDLEIKGFSCAPVDEASEARLLAFSTSEEVRYMKLNFGKRFLMDDLPLVEEGPGDPVLLSSE